MKYGIEESLAQIEERGREMKIRKKRKQAGVLALMSVMLIAVSAAAVYRRVGLKPIAESSSSYGAFMLSEEAGGFILVGVICFAAAVVLTLLCLRFAGRKKEPIKKQEQNTPAEKTGEETEDS
ncbi:MAG: hypothetical protein J5643_08800 [Lachnospiraceae bacterium]|nr:hypothetical protein [Lachnospiraceae bacterium]